MTIEEQVESIYDEFYELVDKYTLENKEIIFKLIQKAIPTKDKELELTLRFEYLSQLVFLGFYDEAIAYYPWFLNYKKNNELGYYENYQLVWSFKWIILRIANYSKIQLDQIFNLFEQFEKEVKEFCNGSGDKLIEYFGLQLHLNLGNLKVAEEKYKKYKKLRKTSELDDCLACQINNNLDFHIAKKDYKKAITEAKDIVSKKHSCKSVPKTTYPKLTFCHLMLGNELKAEEFYQLSMKNLNFKEPQLTNISDLLFFVARKNLYLRSAKIIDAQLDFAFKSNSDVDRFNFFLSCYLVFKNAEINKVKIFKLKKNEQVDWQYNEKGKGYETSELKSWFEEKAKKHMILLDNRNKNTFYEEYFNYMIEQF